MPWQEAADAEMYSASQDDNATTPCFTEFHVIAEFPMKKTCPDVLFRSKLSPAKSLSLKP